MLFTKKIENIKKIEKQIENCQYCQGTGFLKNSTQESIDDFMLTVKKKLFEKNPNNKEFCSKFLTNEEDILNSLSDSNNNLFTLCNFFVLQSARNRYICKTCQVLKKELSIEDEKVDSIRKELGKYFNNKLIFDSLLEKSEVDLKKRDYSEYSDFIRAYAECSLIKHKFENRLYRVGMFNLYDLIQQNANTDNFKQFEIIFLFNIEVANELTSVRFQYLQNLTSFFQMNRIKIFYHANGDLKNNKFLENLGIKKQTVAIY